MGMYCCCDWKMTGSMYIDIPNRTTNYYESDPDRCTCDWNNWVSVYDWPEERKNKHKEFSLPKKDGKYLVRCQSSCGDRYEEIQSFSLKTRIETCGYTGKEFEVHWSGDDERQPYAWRELKESVEGLIMKRERIEDLGKLSVMIGDIFLDDFLIEKYFRRPKDSWDSFCNLDENQKQEYVLSVAYGIERIKEKLADCLYIANGDIYECKADLQ